MGAFDEFVASQGGAAVTANPSPPVSADGVFDRFFGTLRDLGGDYLTLQGQLAVAKQAADMQQRINSYSAVNPSLGAVDPAAAQRVANQTLLQRFLPTGSPTVGTPASGTVAANTTLRWVIIGVVALVGIVFLVRILRK